MIHLVLFLFCFGHRRLVFRYLELDSVNQENKFIEYEHERAILMLFFLIALYLCAFSKECEMIWELFYLSFKRR